MLGQWPALDGQGISQTVFTLDPCALRPAHVHPRATGLLYLISGEHLALVAPSPWLPCHFECSCDTLCLLCCPGTRFVVGFVTEDGVPVTNEISTGASALFPIGERCNYAHSASPHVAPYSQGPYTNSALPSWCSCMGRVFKLKRADATYATLSWFLGRAGALPAEFGLL